VASGREQYLQALASLSDLTRTQAERVAGLLAKQGEVQSAQVGRVAEDLLRRTQKNREIMSRLVQREVKRQLGLFGMATRDEVARLQQRVRALEQELERAGKAPEAGATRPTTSTSKARAASAGSGTTRSSPRASKAGSATAKPSTRTRTGGASSRSTASSPGTRTGGAGSPSSASPRGTGRARGTTKPKPAAGERAAGERAE
jgi:polyhydroxyalkanoate synthesis regulator phasin